MAKQGRSFNIDLIIPNVGRIKKRTGTTNPKVYDSIKVMFDQLREKADYAKLRAIKAGTVSIMEVYEAWSNQALSKLDVSDAGKPFSFIYEWLETYTKAGAAAKANYKSALNQIKKLAPASAKVRDLPDLLRKYKALCLRDDKPRAFGIAKNACRAYLKDTAGKSSALYLAVEQIENLDETPERKATALSVRQVEELTAKVGGDAGQMVWSMCSSGIESNVYFNPDKWSQKGDTIEIRGEKMKRKDDRRNRTVPLVLTPVVPTMAVKKFRRLITEADPTVKIGDFRKSYSRWLYEAGVSPLHIKSYMGHALNMSEHYGISDLKGHMGTDGETLRKFIAANRKEKPKAKVKIEGTAEAVAAVVRMMKHGRGNEGP